MPASLECPALESWQAWLAGTTPADQWECCERHLESCVICQERLERAKERGDPLVKLGQAFGDPTTYPHDPALTQVLDRLHELKSPIRSVLVEPVDLYFLRPSNRPGVMGLLGDYEVQEVIGQGGMGVVLKAYDPGLHRLVAIKVMAAAVAGSATARKRFTREAQAAAAVCHDHIVIVHGVYESNGLPYLVMQYIAGESLQDRLDRTGPLETIDIVRIGMQTASALAAAHAQGLIHRDIKPANLLLENGLARVKITDFGLARTVDDVQLTQNGVVTGTPEYMAPEQARGEPVDHRADLFSLGSVLYATCIGVPPFRGSTTLAVLRQVSDQEPTPIRSLNPDVPAWLEAIIDRLLAKNPAERFQTAGEVAQLLEGFLAHLRQPTTVPAPPLPPSPAGRSRRPRPGTRPGGFDRLLHRFRLPTLLLLTLLGLGLVGVGFSEAVGMTDLAGKVFALLGAPGTLRVEAADPEMMVWVVARGKKPIILSSKHKEIQLRAGQYIVRGNREGAPTQEKEVQIKSGEKKTVYFFKDPLAAPPPRPAEALPVPPPEVPAPAARTRVNGAPGRMDSLWGHTGPVHNILYTRDGRLVSAGGWPEGDCSVRVWNLKTGLQQSCLKMASQVHALDLSPDGRYVLVGLASGIIWRLELETGKAEWLPCQGHTAEVSWVAFAPRDPRYAFSTASDGTARMWDLREGKEIKRFPGPCQRIRAGAVSPDGRLLVTGGENEALQLWDTTTGKEIKRIPVGNGWINSLAFTADGRQVLIANRQAALWDLETEQQVQFFGGHGQEVHQAVLRPDGRAVLTGSWDGRVRLFEVQTGLLRVLGSHDGFVFTVAFSPDGRQAASAGGGQRQGDRFTAGQDHAIRLWNLTMLPWVGDFLRLGR